MPHTGSMAFPLGAFAAMSLGACLGAAWLWCRLLGIAVVSGTLTLSLVTTFIFAWSEWQWIRANFQMWWVVIALLGFGAAALAGASAMLRRISIRGC